MPENILKRVYRKKHFFTVTWARSEELLASTPWLKPEQHEFCMIGYYQPTCEEAETFIGSIMYDRLFDTVVSVREISKEEALRDFQMDNWRNQKVFGGDKRLPSPTQMQIVDSYDIDGQSTLYTVSLAPSRLVDIKACKDTGLIYVMQNADGSVVYGDEDTEVTFPDYKFDEASVVRFVKNSTLNRDDLSKTPLSERFQSAANRAGESSGHDTIQRQELGR